MKSDAKNRKMERNPNLSNRENKKLKMSKNLSNDRIYVPRRPSRDIPILDSTENFVGRDGGTCAPSGMKNSSPIGLILLVLIFLFILTIIYVIL